MVIVKAGLRMKMKMRRSVSVSYCNFVLILIHEVVQSIICRLHIFKKAVLAHKLRVQMQKALRKTAEELKEEERMKQEEQLRERRVLILFLFRCLRG